MPVSFLKGGTMNKDVLLAGLVFAVLFLIGIEVLASENYFVNESYKPQAEQDEMVITIHRLPTSDVDFKASHLNFTEESLSEQKVSQAFLSEENSEFKIKIHPVSENRSR